MKLVRRLPVWRKQIRQILPESGSDAWEKDEIGG